MKTIKKILVISFFSLILFTGCEENKIDFVVKSNFEIDAVVRTTSYNGSSVSTFIVDSEIDLSDNIDNIDDISTLLVTGVKLELKNYEPVKINASPFGSSYLYYTEPLTGNLTVTLTSNNSNKVIFTDNINLGTNNGPQASNGDSDYRNAQPVILSINETEAKDFIENKKVKLKISMLNGDIRDNDFIIKITVQSEAITSI